MRLRSRLRSAWRRASGADRLACDALTLPMGQISLDESRFLGAKVAGLAGPGPIVEIGTLFGWSTRVMVLFKSPERRLISVDNYGWNPLALTPQQHRACTAEALRDGVARHGVELVEMDKNEFYRTYNGDRPALAFLDAVHTFEETAKDIAWARKLGVRCICVHDYSADHPGVMQAVDAAGGPVELVQTLAVL